MLSSLQCHLCEGAAVIEEAGPPEHGLVVACKVCGCFLVDAFTWHQIIPILEASRRQWVAHVVRLESPRGLRLVPDTAGQDVEIELT